MANPPQDTSGLGYFYHLPSGGFLNRIRNSLTQFSDIFSEFNKYIAPAYHHDRCERSVYMRLYSMHKREFVMVFIGFFICFGLGIVIGLAGPPITNTNEITATSILENTTITKDKNALATGPFVMKTPLTTTYSQQLWLIAKLETSNEDDEKYDKSFQVSVGIDGITESHTPLNILSAENIKNRTRHLLCERNMCEEFIILHLGFLEYAHYIITVKFYDLELFHQKYRIKGITFYFKTYSPAFSQIEIWFRFIFLLFTFIVTCWFAHTLRKYPVYDWSIEQKWMSILLPLLVLYNNPFFPLIFLWNSWFPGMLDGVLQATFLCSLLMFWLCIYHGLRQNERRFVRFYLPKIIVVMPIWFSAIVLATWEKCNELRDPTYNHFVDTKNYEGFKMFFYIAGTMYILYLALLVLKSYSELRSMPFFDMRLKFLTLLMLVVLSISLAVTVNRFGFGILEDNFVANLKTTYKSSAQFMCFYGLLNFYLYTMAYVYSPNGKSNEQITKDNPAFSMINDSDEDVVYGSDDESRRPLNSSSNTTGSKNDYDSD
ncbi:transmembrane protein 181 [Condylostylus longicornis]|uniref:transmembrane protein 181 n=1 Tax=Condylostylus longicornis TaxID=2530218 RepID=UPI00244E3804|nr:transmembrane protein 181 [Condylostylus longicornis]